MILRYTCSFGPRTVDHLFQPGINLLREDYASALLQLMYEDLENRAQPGIGSVLEYVGDRPRALLLGRPLDPSSRERLHERWLAEFLAYGRRGSRRSHRLRAAWGHLWGGDLLRATKSGDEFCSLERRASQLAEVRVLRLMGSGYQAAFDLLAAAAEQEVDVLCVLRVPSLHAIIQQRLPWVLRSMKPGCQVISAVGYSGPQIAPRLQLVDKLS